jgi:hypothetical protein
MVVAYDCETGGKVVALASTAVGFAPATAADAAPAAPMPAKKARRSTPPESFFAIQTPYPVVVSSVRWGLVGRYVGLLQQKALGRSCSDCHTGGTAFRYARTMSVSYLFPPEEGVDVLATPAISPKPKRNTKAIGDLSELEVAIALARAGYIVSKPLGDSHRYDLVIDDGETLSRVQVKTGRLNLGAIRVSCCSSHRHRGGTSRSYRGQSSSSASFVPRQATRIWCQNRISSTRICTFGLPPPLIGKTGIYGGRVGTSWRSLVVKHVLGKDESVGSIPTASSS